MDRPRLEPGERAKLLLAGGERGERLARVGGEDPAGLGEPAPAAVALDEALPAGCLEQAKMLAGARLADPDRTGCSRDASVSLQLDEQPEASGVP